MKRVAELLDKDMIGNKVSISGWVRTFRNNQFIAINDGSSLKNIQAVLDMG